MPNFYKNNSNFFYNPYRRNFYNNYTPYSPNPINVNSCSPKDKCDSVVDNNINNNSTNLPPNKDFILELFGLKLYFDDVLILSLLFFLYKENVKDDWLFLSLIMILIS